MTIYRARHEVEVEADINYTVIQERDRPYPNDRTAITVFQTIYGDNLVSIEDLEENRIVYERPSEAEEPLGDMKRAELDEVARSLGIDPKPLSNKAQVIVAIDLARKSG